MLGSARPSPGRIMRSARSERNKSTKLLAVNEEVEDYRIKCSYPICSSVLCVTEFLCLV